MNGEKLLDALALVEEDLLEPVALLRERKRMGIPWMRYASLAACVCVLAGGILVWHRMYHGMSGTTTETMAGVVTEAVPETTWEEGAPETEAAVNDGETMAVPETEAAEDVTSEGAPLYSGTVLQEIFPENVQYIRTDGYAEGVKYPMVYILRTPEMLEEYYQGNRDRYDLSPRKTVYADSTIGFADAITQYDAAWFAEHDLVMVVLEEGSGSIRHEVYAITETPEKWSIGITSIEPEVCTADMAQWHILIEVEKDLIDVTEPIPIVVE